MSFHAKWVAMKVLPWIMIIAVSLLVVSENKKGS
jgi:hypothetical protein